MPAFGQSTPNIGTFPGLEIHKQNSSTSNINDEKMQKSTFRISPFNHIPNNHILPTNSNDENLNQTSVVNSECDEISLTFNYIEGSTQQFTIPNGVTSVNITAYGASGGDSPLGSGVQGGRS